MMHKRRAGSRAFAILVQALAAIVQRKPQDLIDALGCVPTPAFLACASRHRCIGELLRGIDALGVAGRLDRALIHQLQDGCKRAAVASFAHEAQLVAVIKLLHDASVPTVLLKSAARLYAGQQGAHWDPLFDFDLLIQATDTERAADALFAAGYTQRAPNPEWYRREHHHLAPLRPAGGGLAIELHTQLAPPGLLSQTFDWIALEQYFETVEGSAGRVARLNEGGSALHLMIHGLGLRDSGQSWGGILIERLRDATLLARQLRDDPVLLSKLVSIARADQRQSTGLEAVLCVAAFIAGVRASFDRKAQRYAAYAIRREQLPRSLRHRLRVADAWFGSGSRFTPSVVRASAGPRRPHRPLGKVLEPFRIAGRITLGVLVALYAFVSRPALKLNLRERTDHR